MSTDPAALWLPARSGRKAKVRNERLYRKRFVLPKMLICEAQGRMQFLPTAALAPKIGTSASAPLRRNDDAVAIMLKGLGHASTRIALALAVAVASYAHTRAREYLRDCRG
jgi:hypothetical protein